MDQLELLKAVEAKNDEIASLKTLGVKTQTKIEALEAEKKELLKNCQHVYEDGTSALMEKAHKPSGTHWCWICIQCLFLDGLTPEERLARYEASLTQVTP